MANQWNGTIATQTVAFRGLSQVFVRSTNSTFPNHRTITDAVYSMVVTGGISGTFGVNVVGHLGSASGATFIIAGLTALTAAGNYILFPFGYSSTGAGLLAYAPSKESLVTLDKIVPPTYVGFQSAVATVGISANCTVSVALHLDG